MIRQAISCDICGAEKRQTNHWFVAKEQAGELRVSGWNARTRLRANSKHLCGQACLHKLADEFMERIIARPQAGAEIDEHDRTAAPVNTSLTASQIFDDFESSARLIPTPPASIAARATSHPAATLVPMPTRAQIESSSQPLQEAPRFASRSWHAEAWQRERERALQTSGRRPEVIGRRISQA